MPSKPRQGPQTFEELTRTIHEQFEGLSKTNRQIAVYLTQNPNDVAMSSVNMIAEKCGIHASSFVRFAQGFGYSGFKELQQVFRERLTTAAPGFETRAQQMRADAGRRRATGLRAHLQELVIGDADSLERLIAGVDEARLETAVSLLAAAQTVFLVGQLRSEPIVVLLRYILTMLGRRAILLDSAGGLATQMSKIATEKDVLIAVSFRYYATEVVNIVDDLANRGVPVIGITDTTLSPLAKSSKVIFDVPERDHAFSRSLAAPICLAQGLMLGLAARLSEDETASPVIPVATRP